MKLFSQADDERPDQQLHLQASLLLAAGREAVLFNELLKSNARLVPKNVQEKMMFHYSRFFTLFDRAGGNITPKFHLLYHGIFQISVYGNPRYFATYVDESFNGAIAAIARSCHRLTWTESIFRKLAAIEKLDSKRLAGFNR